MDGKKFKSGDRIYHINLNLYGTFIDYVFGDDNECDVELKTENGIVEYNNISVRCIKLVCKHRKDDGICLKGASSSGKCIYPSCSYYER